MAHSEASQGCNGAGRGKVGAGGCARDVASRSGGGGPPPRAVPSRYPRPGYYPNRCHAPPRRRCHPATPQGHTPRPLSHAAPHHGALYKRRGRPVPCCRARPPFYDAHRGRQRQRNARSFPACAPPAACGRARCAGGHAPARRRGARQRAACALAARSGRGCGGSEWGGGHAACLCREGGACGCRGRAAGSSSAAGCGGWGWGRH